MLKCDPSIRCGGAASAAPHRQVALGMRPKKFVGSRANLLVFWVVRRKSEHVPQLRGRSTARRCRPFHFGFEIRFHLGDWPSKFSRRLHLQMLAGHVPMHGAVQY